MKPELIRAERELQGSYWWFVGRRAILKSVLNRFVKRVHIGVDIGCGSGQNMPLLSEYADFMIGLDSSPVALEALDAAKTGLARADGHQIPLANCSVGLLNALDVLEHMDDDLQALNEFHRVLRSDGFLLVTVPAYRFLWSEHDEALMHRRRYIASELHAKLNRSGFRVLKRTYVVFFPFIPIVFYRLFRGVFPKDPFSPKASHVILPAVLNSFFIALLKCEAWMIGGINLPFGTSILFLAQKAQGGTASSQ